VTARTDNPMETAYLKWLATAHTKDELGSPSANFEAGYRAGAKDLARYSAELSQAVQAQQRILTLLGVITEGE
jgi:hypothetical protein